MDKRREELTKLKSYTEKIDNELTMILQNLQWDRNHLLQNPTMITCRYDSNHKIPPDKSDEHEKECFLRLNGYTNEDCLLPGPLDTDSSTLVKLSKADIEQIIGNAARSDPLFKRGVGCRGAEPMSLERLQSSYSSDERRAIHDAVVSAVPACHDLTDLALLSGGDDQSSKVTILSRTDILAELRNMRRRRTKYRVAAKTRNYSDVLRDVIKTQMEHYNEGKNETTPKESQDERNVKESDNSGHIDNRDYRHESRRRVMPRPIGIEIKTEREDSLERIRDYSRERSDRAYRYEVRGRERNDRYRDRSRYNERSRERRNNEDLDRSDRHAEQFRKRRRVERSEIDYRDEDRIGTRKHSSKERKHDDDSNRERRPDKRSRKGDKHPESDLTYQVKREPGYDEDRNTRKDRSRERRRDENIDKHHKHKDRISDKMYDDSHRRDREEQRREKERRHEDRRYKERSSERIHIKQEREDSATRKSSKRNIDRPSEGIYIKQEREVSTSREETSRYETYKSNDSRHKNYEGRNDRSYREQSYDSYTKERSIKEEPYERYYGNSEAVYDANKEIKVEK